MDRRLLLLYDRELQHIQEMAAEFARARPNTAKRLGMEGIDVEDPYVERLLEGFAFLAARVQLQIESEFPRFTENLLDLVYPHYLPPLPSMVVAQFFPLLEEGALVEGFTLPRDTVLQAQAQGGERTALEFRTAHAVTFWPVEVTEATYFDSADGLASIGIERLTGIKAGIRIRLRTAGGVAFDELPLDSLVFFLRGPGQVVPRLKEQLIANAASFVVRPKGGSQSWQEHHPASNIVPRGFDRDESLIPPSDRTFEGYRYLQEFFAFPQRFSFLELRGLQPSIAKCGSTELELIVLMDRSDPELVESVDKDNFTLNCAPAINLFPKRTDRIRLAPNQHEYHVVPDRNRPLDFEVWSVKRVHGFGTSASPETEFLPYFAAHDHSVSGQTAFFTVHREARVVSSKQRERGHRSGYLGSETFISIVDPLNAPFRTDLRQLEVQTLCTNRDLPINMSAGRGNTDFTLETGAPVNAIRCVAGPTKPRASHASGETAWRLINHLSLNYNSLMDDSEKGGARALRAFLNLYIDQNDATMRRQIEGIASVEYRPVHRRAPLPGPVTYTRGVEVTVTCDESAFESVGPISFGLVLREFFSKYVSTNSFTETVLRSIERGEIKRWPPRVGCAQTL